MDSEIEKAQRRKLVAETGLAELALAKMSGDVVAVDDVLESQVLLTFLGGDSFSPRTRLWYAAAVFREFKDRDVVVAGTVAAQLAEDILAVLDHACAAEDRESPRGKRRGVTCWKCQSETFIGEPHACLPDLREGAE